MDQQSLNELQEILNKIELKSAIVKDEKESNETYQDYELQIKELRELQKQALEESIPDVLSELEALKKEFKEALSAATSKITADKQEAKDVKKRVAKYAKLKFKGKFGEFSEEVHGILKLNKEG